MCNKTAIKFIKNTFPYLVIILLCIIFFHSSYNNKSILKEDASIIPAAGTYKMNTTHGESVFEVKNNEIELIKGKKNITIICFNNDSLGIQNSAIRMCSLKDSFEIQTSNCINIWDSSIQYITVVYTNK